MVPVVTEIYRSDFLPDGAYLGVWFKQHVTINDNVEKWLLHVNEWATNWTDVRVTVEKGVPTVEVIS